MDAAKTLWTGFCLPAQIFPVVMTGIVLFNIWIGAGGQAVRNIIFGLIGTACLSVLCSSGLETLAYILLTLPVIFFMFLLALIVYDQSLLNVTHNCVTCDKDDNHPEMCNGCH